MKKHCDYYENVRNCYHKDHLRTIGNNKISFLPSLNYNFQELIFDRLNSESAEQPKSIFFLKGKFNRNIQCQESNNIKSVSPDLTISQNLGLARNKIMNNKTIHLDRALSINCSKGNYGRETKLIKRNPSIKDQRQNRRLNNQRNYHMQKAKRNKEKQYIKLDDILVGNRTRLNFRPNETSSKRQKGRNTEYGKTKIKFGTFFNEEVCPWKLLDRYEDENSN